MSTATDPAPDHRVRHPVADPPWAANAAAPTPSATHAASRAGWPVQGVAGRHDGRHGDDHFAQAGNLWRLLPAGEQQRLADNVAGSLAPSTPTRCSARSATSTARRRPTARRCARRLPRGVFQWASRPAAAARRARRARRGESR